MTNRIVLITLESAHFGERFSFLSLLEDASSVGEVIVVAGDTFTSRNEGWIYTWSKDGRKINTRSAH